MWLVAFIETMMLDLFHLRYLLPKLMSKSKTPNCCSKEITAVTSSLQLQVQKIHRGGQVLAGDVISSSKYSTSELYLHYTEYNRSKLCISHVCRGKTLGHSRPSEST